MMATMPMGTLTKKIQCQEAYSTSTPPSVGPTAAATEPITPHRPSPSRAAVAGTRS